MSPYTCYNATLALVFVPAVYWITSREQRFRTLLAISRVATLMALTAYPWDYFAISYKVWRYPNHPGPALYGVPVNDLIFIWLCTFLASGVLLASVRWESSKRPAKCENADHQHAEHQRL